MQLNDLIGRRIGPYEIIGELGRGGSARVYKAYQESMHRYVAIKVLVNDSEDRLGFVRRFEREVEVVAQLSHPNIVAVYDTGEVEELVYLVMQYVNGGTFRQRLGQPLAVADACAAVIQVARALQHAHARGIVHRDVKPSNMLIETGEESRILLTDFGIAKLQGMHGLTKSGTTIGTPEYMAPEQAEGREIDARADVYSLGCVLYEALAGRAPFIGATPVSVLYQQVHTRPDYIRGLNPQVPRELARVIEVALAKRPEDRFTSAESFAQALRPFTLARDRGTFSGPVTTFGPRLEAAAAELDLRSAPRSGGFGTGADTGGATHASGTGLGAEGLDAIFPQDPEAQAVRNLGARGAAAAGPAVPAGLLEDGGYLPASALLPDELRMPSAHVPAVTGGPRPTIPLKAFNLPSRDAVTQPLDLPLTSEGQLDMDALMTQVDQQPTIPDDLAWEPPPDLPPYGEWQGPEDVPFFGEWDTGADRPGYDVGQFGAPGGWDGAPTEYPADMQAGSGPSAEAELGLPPPIWRPESLTMERATGRLRVSLPGDLPALPRLTRSRLSRPILAGIMAAVVLVVALAIWLAVSVSGLGLVKHAPTSPPATAAIQLPTATTALTPTPSPPPAGTPTPTQQQLLDKRAAAAFRAVTLSTTQDLNCSSVSSRKTFASWQSVWVNLCVAQSAPAGNFSVELRHGGAVMVVMARSVAATAGYSYAYAQPNLAPGTYDVLVTFDGGTAADLTLTVR